ncbi:MAG TPA: FAD-dependent oxidoreductase [Polyangiaceae bacterium]|nr:FAD-dependent oxidoreductase [Polyangiaceae bacterium]
MSGTKPKILVLGAGFAGLELCTTLSEELGDSIEVTLIDESDAFMFGFSKLDVLFGKKDLPSVRLPYDDFSKPGVRRVKQSITAIDPADKRVTTNVETHVADFLVVALGADYDFAATPGLLQHGNEFYSVSGAERLRTILPTFSQGKVVIGVCGAPFKCPPAPSEAALMLHDYLSERGVRANCEITLVIPFGTPVPPSPDTSKALLAAFAERDIRFIPSRRVASLKSDDSNSAHGVAVLDDGTELPYELFMGVPKNCAPKVVLDSPLAQDGWIAVNPKTLETRFPGVYAAGDGANTGTPKAGVFAEGAARAVAKSIIAQLQNKADRGSYPGKGSCYIEFGGDRIARVDVDFFSGPAPTGTFQEPSTALRVEKNEFGRSRRARWFGQSS